MPRSTHKLNRFASASRRRGRASLAAAAAAIVAVAIAAGASLAVAGVHAHASATVRVVSPRENAALGKKIVVDSRGRTLYALTPETARHLLCKSRACLAIWPPLLVHSASVKLVAGAGVSGRLGVVRRGVGRFQVTLRGLPLYRFAGDKGAAEANGEGIKSFGGTWHAAAAAVAPRAGSPLPPAPPPPAMPYGY